MTVSYEHYWNLKTDQYQNSTRSSFWRIHNLLNLSLVKLFFRLEAELCDWQYKHINSYQQK